MGAPLAKVLTDSLSTSVRRRSMLYSLVKREPTAGFSREASRLGKKLCVVAPSKDNLT